jgi:outer membrane protein OmpU
MKKLLIASTALVASAGFAAADVSLSGNGNMGVRYDSTGFGAGRTATTAVHSELNFQLNGTQTTDGGLQVGGTMALEQDNGTSAFADTSVFISTNGLTLTFGDVTEAGGVGIADVGFDSIGVDDAIEGLDEGGAHNVHLAYTFDKFTVSVSGTVNDTTAAADLTAATSGFGVGIVYNDTAGSGLRLGAGYQDFIGAGRQVNVSVGYTVGSIAMNAVYLDQSGGVNTDGWGVDFTYRVDPALSITIAASDTTAAGISPSYGIGAAYDLGGGVTLAGGIGSIDEGATTATRADFGLTFTF